MVPKPARAPALTGTHGAPRPNQALAILLLLVAAVTLPYSAFASPNAPSSLSSSPTEDVGGAGIDASAAAAIIAGSANRWPRSGGDASHWDLDGLKMRLFNLGTASRDVLHRLGEEARVQVVAMEQVIEQTGLDVDDLLAHFGNRRQGAGGPFIAVAPSAHDAGPNVTDVGLNSSLVRWDLLRDVIRSLPLAEPLDAYKVTSPFGKRRDPFNRRWAMHEGVDLVAPLKTPIVATAPGTVVFAGWKGSYGRLVEISHGPRVTTRYAHLAEILVEHGDTVQTGERIGLLGSSGRSTGPHLHYEVLFDKVHRDPMMFIQAGQAEPSLAVN
jgi:murein DD-endopeptidase MepM/ murein hydrolase activator NlpD